MDILHAYALLRDACHALDETGDHAVAAYVGHGMALLETRYGIDPDAVAYDRIVPAPPTDARDSGSNWA